MLRSMLPVIAMVLVACEQAPSTAVVSPSPAAAAKTFGMATLSAEACNFAMPDVMPVELVKFHLVNSTTKTGRFILGQILPGHTFQELLDYWNGPNGQLGPPNFTSEVALQDVSAGGSDDMPASIPAEGTYAFHCGYVNDSGTVTAFWHELHARAA